MATFNFYGRIGPSLDEALNGAAIQVHAEGGEFHLGRVNGPKIVFYGTGFANANGVPSAGTIAQITVFNSAGEAVYDVGGLDPDYASLPAFWTKYTQAGSAAAFERLLTGENIRDASSTHDRIGVYGNGYVLNGMDGDDTFIVYEGVKNAQISGTNSLGHENIRQTDRIDLRGSASFTSLTAIDVLSFASSNAAKKVTYNANSIFGVSRVVGSEKGADTILFTTASQAADLDISGTVFSKWGRADQIIRVALNTDSKSILDDRFVGSSAGEHVTAGNGRDLLYGNKGNDHLDGGDEIDVLDGGDGNDTLIGGGGEGPNILKGGKGNDVYKFNEKVDIIIDSGGLDSRVVRKTSTLSTKDRFEGLAADEALSAKTSVSLTGTDKANVLLGHSGKNTLNGRGGNDIIEGRAGSDKLNGDAGSDKMSGGLGNDSLTGAAGNDRLTGGLGKDVLNGGAGKDIFVFETTLSSSNLDRISGFSTKDDTIALEKDVFLALTGSKLSSSAFYKGTKAHDSNDRIIYNKTTGVLYYDADGSGTGSALTKFAQLDKNLKLAASDFILL